MAQNETAYKKRVATAVRRLATLTRLPVWMTALGVGAKAGIPDSWMQIGGFIFFVELKRKSKKARALQQERIDMLLGLNQVAFCLAANPDSLGADGEERRELHRTLLTFVEKDAVLRRAKRYVQDCNKLRILLEHELDR